MKYRIEYTLRAIDDLESAFQWIGQDSPRHAAKWRGGMLNAIESLSHFPKRCPLAPENDAFKSEIRQLLYGKNHGIYRILFTIQKRTVFILHIRHTARNLIGTE